MATHYSSTNLAMTVYPTYRGVTKCTGVDPETGRNIGNYHSWLGKNRVPLLRCRLCHKTRKEAQQPKPISLHEALKGN